MGKVAGKWLLVATDIYRYKAAITKAIKFHFPEIPTLLLAMLLCLKSFTCWIFENIYPHDKRSHIFAPGCVRWCNITLQDINCMLLDGASTAWSYSRCGIAFKRCWQFQTSCGVTRSRLSSYKVSENVLSNNALWIRA